MRVRRLVWVALIAAAVAGLVYGTGGFTAAEVQRGVSVSTAPHDEAFLTLYDPGAGSDGDRPTVFAGTLGEEPVGPGGDRVRVLLVANRFPGTAPLSLDVDGRAVESPRGTSVSDVEGPSGLRRGDYGWVRATVDCGSHRGPTPIGFELTAVGDGLSVVVEYEATVVCIAPPDTKPPG
jgi:hypothetical protein